MGWRLEDLDWLDLRALVRHSPRESALYRATHPEWWVTTEVGFLRDIEFSLRVLRWQNTTDAPHGLNYPKPVLLTEAERQASAPERDKYEPMEVGDMLAWLGWTKPSPN